MVCAVMYCVLSWTLGHLYQARLVMRCSVEKLAAFTSFSSLESGWQASRLSHHVRAVV